MTFLIQTILGWLRRPREPKEGRVYLPTLLLFIGLTEWILFVVFAIVSWYSEEALWVPIGFLIFSLLGITLIVAFINCRITYDSYEFEHRNFFGIKRTTTYDQVSAIKENPHETYLYVGKRRIMIDEFSIGGHDFLKMVKTRYRATHNGQPLPKIQERKTDLFNGNIRNPGEFLIVFIAMGILCFGLLGTSLLVCFLPNTPNNTTKQTVQFAAYRPDELGFALISADHQTYRLRYYSDLDLQPFINLCYSDITVTAYVDKVDPEEEEPYFSIKAIEQNNKYILSFDDVNRLKRQEYFPLVLLTGGLLLFWILFVIGAIKVGKNPRKYSKAIVRLFFKDEYIN